MIHRCFIALVFLHVTVKSMNPPLSKNLNFIEIFPDELVSICSSFLGIRAILALSIMGFLIFKFIDMVEIGYADGLRLASRY